MKRSRLSRLWLGRFNSEYRKLDADNVDKGNDIVLGALSKLRKLNYKKPYYYKGHIIESTDKKGIYHVVSKVRRVKR